MRVQGFKGSRIPVKEKYLRIPEQYQIGRNDAENSNEIIRL